MASRLTARFGVTGGDLLRPAHHLLAPRPVDLARIALCNLIIEARQEFHSELGPIPDRKRHHLGRGHAR